jgi:hypothetical protein
MTGKRRRGGWVRHACPRIHGTEAHIWSDTWKGTRSASWKGRPRSTTYSTNLSVSLRSRWCCRCMFSSRRGSSDACRELPAVRWPCPLRVRHPGETCVQLWFLVWVELGAARKADDEARWHERLAEVIELAAGNDWPRHMKADTEQERGPRRLGPHPTHEAPRQVR